MNRIVLEPPRRVADACFAPPKGGRPPEARAKAEAFIVSELEAANDLKTAALVERWTDQGGGKSSFFDALKALEAAGRLVRDGKPQVLHLIRSASPVQAAAMDSRPR